MERQYGRPEFREYQVVTTDRELRRIRSSQRDGRNHDVTVYVEMRPAEPDGQVENSSRLIVIAKHMYPAGLFRAPSGGLHPGEDFHQGVHREMREELGCEVALDRFILRTDVTFVCGSESVRWRSFVFLGHYLSGRFDFTDRHEIREVALVDWEDFARFGQMMRRTDIGGLHYRAMLHEEVATLLGKPA